MRIAPSKATAPRSVGQSLSAVLRSLAQSGLGGANLSARLTELTPKHRWNRVAGKKLEFLAPDGKRLDYHVHPQGMARDPRSGRIYVSAVEITEARQPEGKANGKGLGWLFEFDASLKPLRSIRLSNKGDDAFHPGGLTFSDGKLYVPIAPYHPNSSAKILELPVDTLRPQTIATLNDHVGTVGVGPKSRDLLMFSWNSEQWYRMDPRGEVVERKPNPTPGRLAHQDSQLLPDGNLVLTGVIPEDTDHFGLDILEPASGALLHSVRWDGTKLRNPQGHVPLHNPSLFWVDEHDRLMVAVAPDSQFGKYREQPHGASPSAAKIPETHKKSGELVFYELSRA